MISKSCGLVLNGNHTDIVVNVYSNRVFLIVSQYRKLGSLVSVSKESVVYDEGTNVFSAKVIFGKDEPEISAVARYIAGELKLDKPLLVAVCLKDFEKSTLRTIVGAIKEILPQASRE